MLKYYFLDCFYFISAFSHFCIFSPLSMTHVSQPKSKPAYVLVTGRMPCFLKSDAAVINRHYSCKKKNMVIKNHSSKLKKLKSWSHDG